MVSQIYIINGFRKEKIAIPLSVDMGCYTFENEIKNGSNFFLFSISISDTEDDQLKGF